jgi:DNA-binding NarL/FixJ family response regulator
MLERLGLMAQNQEDTHTPDDMAADSEVQQVVAALTPLQQRICLGLMNGMSELRIAAVLDRHYTTICRHVGHIRQAFAARGFDAWFVQ